MAATPAVRTPAAAQEPAAEHSAPPAAPAPTGPWGPGFGPLRREDPELAGLLLAEADRQACSLNLMAGESTASAAVLAALGSPLTDKYAEGYPGERHHAGCEIADLIERLAVDRALALFGAGHANVQPHSGTGAMLAAFAALLVPGDTVLAFSPAHGGHLTSGSPASFSGRWFHVVGYGVRRSDGLIDYDEVRELAHEHRPQAIVCGGTAYPRHLDYAAFREIADEVDAYLVADAAHTLGLVAAGVAPSPVPFADVVAATTHKTLRGPRGGLLLCRAEHAHRIDRAVFPFAQGGPQLHTVAAKAAAFGEAARPEFTEYARRAVDGARALATGLAGEGPAVLTGGTDTHLVCADTTALGVTGAQARGRCAAVRIVLDKYTLPFDPLPGADASGIRTGTAAMAARGMGEAEFALAARLVGRALRGERAAGHGRGELRAEVAELAAAFPPYE
jgi:glycine hydroxymethyltransferase